MLEIGNGTHGQDKVQGIVNEGNETIALVETSGGIIFGMHNNTYRANLPAGTICTLESVHQKHSAKSTSLVSLVNGQTPQKNNGDNRVTR